MPEPLHVLILDDNPSDAELMAHELRRAGLDPLWTRVDTEAAFLAALDDAPDVILADYSLPGFDAFRALNHLRERQLEIPCLVVTGTIGDELAAELIKQGACDYLLKDRLGRLGGAVQGALEQRHLRMEKRRAEESLRERSEQLRALASELTLAEHRERRRVAGILHDDLQQFLVSARMRVTALQRGTEEELRQTAVEVEELISQSIEVTRSLTRELSPPVLYEGGLVPALEWLGRWMQEKHGLTVDLTSTDTVTPETEDVRVLLFQTVRELLFNVVKHAQVMTASVHVSRLDGQIQIVVSDNGVGFDPAQLRQAGSSGSGFGLFSIRERLDLLGGRMEMESAPGKGSRFRLLAPLGASAAEPTREASPAAGGRKSRRVPSRVKKIRVLLVDDHVIIRQGLTQLLNAEPDIEVVGEASEGRAVVGLTRQLLPDVVIMDVSLPEMNGMQATRALHAVLPEVQVIGLSMFEDKELGEAMREAGAVSYVSKMGPSDALIAAIRACRSDPGGS
jgi:signal transduction histidine kinase